MPKARILLTLLRTTGEWLTILVITLLSGCSTYVIEPGNYNVWDGSLPESEIHPCSHPGPPEFETTWKLTDDVVSQLEEDLPQLRRLKADMCCLEGWKIDDLNKYHRVYYGIVVRGKRLVYISNGGAFICDCGPSCWAVLYDPSARLFYNLRFGGLA